MKLICKKSLSILICAALLLTGCGSASPSAGTVSSSSSVPAVPAVVYDDSLIGESISAEGSYQARDGSAVSYSFHVPRIDSDADAAKALNEQIEQQVGAYAEELAAAAGRQETLYDRSITWESHWLDSMVTLVIRTGENPKPGQYLVYHYDFADGSIPDNREILRRMKVSGEDFVQAARRAILAENDSAYTGIPMDEWYGQTLYGRVLAMRSQTLRDFDPDHTMLIPDGEGCSILARHYDLASAEYRYNGWNYRRSPLSLSHSSHEEMQASDGKVTAVLRDGRLTLSFTEEFRSEMTREQPGLPLASLSPGTEYPVSGLFSDCTALDLVTIGRGYAPFVLLQTAHGTPELVNVRDGLRYGYPCAYPLYGIWQIQSMDFAPDGTLRTITDGHGMTHDPEVWTRAALTSIPRPPAGKTPFRSENCTLLFGDDTGHSLELRIRTGAEEQILKGSYYLLGMEENGLVYRYTLGEQTGTLGLRQAWDQEYLLYSNTDYEVRCLSGPELFPDRSDWVRFSPPSFG